MRNDMKGLCLLCGIVCISAAFGMELPRPPECTEIDAESEINVVLDMAAGDLAELCLRVSLESTPTNAMVVALGRDADGDGTFAPSEEEMSFGCDCGTWFVRDAEGFVEELETAAFGRTERELTIPIRGSATDWNLVRVVRHDLAEVDESIVIDATRRRFYIRLK